MKFIRYIPIITLYCGLAHAQESEFLVDILQQNIREGQEAPYTFEHRAMGTEFMLVMYRREGDIGYDDLLPVATDAFEALDALERKISSWINTSDTSRVNQKAHLEPIRVMADVFDLFEVSTQMYKDTHGIFDITVGPLIELWRDPLANDTQPSQEALRNTMKSIGMGRVTMDKAAQTIRFGAPGMRVSFGGIGKGLALDHMLPILKTHGIESALLSGGDSSMYAMGAPPGETFWKIGIYNPYNTQEGVDIVFLRDQALSTSACYQHLSGVTGKPCGIFDPRTGMPVENMMSATVVAPSGMLSDALSTAFYIMGMKDARDYCERHPEVYAVMVANPEDGIPKPIRIGKQGSIKP
ncbi:MAG: FAD:protein FMN transferase [Candidatus Hydrogenedentota bacterium]